MEELSLTLGPVKKGKKYYYWFPGSFMYYLIKSQTTLYDLCIVTL
jgi:hypothetical protein